jgi:hypothetical protein
MDVEKESPDATPPLSECKYDYMVFLSNPTPLKSLNQSNGIIHAFYQSHHKRIILVSLRCYAFKVISLCLEHTLFSDIYCIFLHWFVWGRVPHKGKECKKSWILVFFHK